MLNDVSNNFSNTTYHQSEGTNAQASIFPLNHNKKENSHLYTMQSTEDKENINSINLVREDKLLNSYDNAFDFDDGKGAIVAEEDTKKGGGGVAKQKEIKNYENFFNFIENKLNDDDQKKNGSC